jgi:hypothetical protein
MYRKYANKLNESARKMEMQRTSDHITEYGHFRKATEEIACILNKPQEATDDRTKW